MPITEEINKETIRSNFTHKEMKTPMQDYSTWLSHTQLPQGYMLSVVAGYGLGSCPRHACLNWSDYSKFEMAICTPETISENFVNLDLLTDQEANFCSQIRGYLTLDEIVEIANVFLTKITNEEEVEHA